MDKNARKKWTLKFQYHSTLKAIEKLEKIAEEQRKVLCENKIDPKSVEDEFPKLYG